LSYHHHHHHHHYHYYYYYYYYYYYLAYAYGSSSAYDSESTIGAQSQLGDGSTSSLRDERTTDREDEDDWQSELLQDDTSLREFASSVVERLYSAMRHKLGDVESRDEADENFSCSNMVADADNKIRSQVRQNQNQKWFNGEATNVHPT